VQIFRRTPILSRGLILVANLTAMLGANVVSADEKPNPAHVAFHNKTGHRLETFRTNFPDVKCDPKRIRACSMSLLPNSGDQAHAVTDIKDGESVTWDFWPRMTKERTWTCDSQLVLLANDGLPKDPKLRRGGPVSKDCWIIEIHSCDAVDLTVTADFDGHATCEN
jgi:hypothetical protein